MIADDDVHRHAIENLDRADALLFGRVTYEMMEAAWRLPVPAGAWPAGHGPTLFAGLPKLVDLKLMSKVEFGSGAMAMRYEPR
jgi:hypothetical protein